MAARFWVGGTGTWDAADTTHWSATSGGASGASVPGSGDTVTIDAASGAGTITVNTDFSIVSLTCGQMGMTLDFSANNNSPTISGALTTSGTGTRTINWGSGTFTMSGSNLTIFANGTTTGQTMTGSATFNFTYSGGTGTRGFQFGGTGAGTFHTSTTCSVNITAGTDIVSFSGTNTGLPSLNFTGFSGTWSSTSTSIAFGTNLTMSATMTNSVTAILQWTVNSASGTITSNTKAFTSPFIINTVGGTVTLADAFANPGSATSTITLTSGTLNTNGQSVDTPGILSSNSNVRTLTMGSSAITIRNANAGTVFSFTTSTNLTITANSAVITIIGPSADFDEGTLNWNGASMVITSTSGVAMRGTSTWLNLTRTATSPGVDDALSIAGNKTITGTFTLKGSSTKFRMRLASNQSQSLASTRTITAANIDFEYVNLTDIQAAGAANWDLSAITGLSGDGGGNIGITFTPAVTQYWSGTTGNWTDATKWFLGTGGTGGAGRVPLIQDMAIFDANSFVAAGNTVTVDFANIGPTNWAGSLPGQTFTWSQNIRCYGSMTLVTNTTLSSAFGITFVGRAANTLSTLGNIFQGAVTISAVSNSMSLGSELALAATRTFTVFVGTFTTNNYNITCGLFDSSNTGVRSVTLGTSTITVTGTGTVWNVGTTTNLTFSGASSTIIFTDASAASKTFSTGGAAAAYGNFIALPGGAGAIVFNSNNKSFNSLSITGPKTVTFNAGTTYTVLSPNFSGSSGNVVTLQSSSAGSPFILSTPSGYVRATYASIKDSTATGGAYFEAVNSTNVSGNTGWNFVTASAGGGLSSGKKFAAFGGARPINKVLDSKLHGYRKLGG